MTKWQLDPDSTPAGLLYGVFASHQPKEFKEKDRLLAQKSRSINNRKCNEITSEATELIGKIISFFGLMPYLDFIA
jgi:hypothetical protein